MDRPPSETPASIDRFAEPTTTVVQAVIGGMLCWLAFPPVGWSQLAWIGPIPWLLLVAREELPGRRPYCAMWLGGFVFWLLAVHWIRLPHPLNYLAWFVLAVYLGLYLPVFVALARVGVHRLRMPLWLAAPVAWTGLEWLRAHLLTGFLMGSLAHTQVGHPMVIQIADLTGEYGVSFLIVLVASSLTGSLIRINLASDRRRPLGRTLHALLPLLPGAITLAAILLYGHSRLSRFEQQQRRPGPRIALVQGNTLADWKSDPGKQQRIMDEHVRLSLEAVERSREQDQREVDLVIWPETAFRETLITVEEGYTPPPERVPSENLTAAQNYLKLLTNELGTAVLVGIDRVHVFPDAQGELDYRAYNSAVLVNADGEIVGIYDKMHRVPFGEYIPFADWFPVLYRLTPLTGGISPGEKPAYLILDGVMFSPNICYETAVPHLIVKQTEGPDSRLPDVLVNLTNDAWYWGSSELDMHLACGVFRAVETHMPLVIAANGGLSAFIDYGGVLREVSQRRKPQVLLVDVPLIEEDGGYSGFTEEYVSFYAAWGDWFAGVCVVCCLVLAVVGWRSRKLSRAPTGVGDDPSRSLASDP